MRQPVRLVAAAFAALVLLGAAASAGVGRAAPVGLAGFRAGDPLYFAGDQVEGLPLSAVLRRSDSAEYVSFVYGDCVPEGDTGCAPPIEIQVWPACRRHLTLYATSPPGLDLEPTTVRGVPGALLDGGTRLELQTGRSTVVVFAGSRARVARVARALREVGGAQLAGAMLPPPASGALEGTLAC